MQKRIRFSFFLLHLWKRKTKKEFVFRFSFANLKSKKEFVFRFSFASLKTKNKKGIRYPIFVLKFENEKGKNGIYGPMEPSEIWKCKSCYSSRELNYNIQLTPYCCVRACVRARACVCVHVCIWAAVPCRAVPCRAVPCRAVPTLKWRVADVLTLSTSLRKIIELQPSDLSLPPSVHVDHQCTGDIRELKLPWLEAIPL